MKIEPASETIWSELVQRSGYATPFHDYKWGVYVTGLLGGEYLPLLATKNNSQWLIPGYQLAPWVDGENDLRIGGIGYGGPLLIHEISNPDIEIENVYEILRSIYDELRKTRIYATLYPAKHWSEISKNKAHFGATCKVPLPNNINTLFEGILTGNVRTAIRKSVIKGVTVRAINYEDLEEMTLAHNLLVNTQQRVGSMYATHFELFSGLASKELTQTKGKTFVAYYDDKLVATSTLVYDKFQAFHLFHGWDKMSANSCANQALIWHMMCDAVQLGIKTFNMGESHSEALLKAKMRWGGYMELVPKLKLLN